MDPVVLYAIKRQQNRKRKRLWVHPLNLNRQNSGEHLKIQDMHDNYPERFQEYTRLTPEQFDRLLLKVKPIIEKQDTKFRKALSPLFRLFVTLRHLASGDLIRSIATSYSAGVSSVRKVVLETSEAIWDVLVNDYVKAPTQPEEWEAIATEYYNKWQFPNCVGAIDGKHVQLIAPSNSGSQYFNYKGTFSLVLMATCDADYRFTTIDIGAYGRQSDGGVFAASPLGKLLSEGKAGLGEARQLPGATLKLPMTFVADEAFPLRCYMMRPYPGKELNTSRRIFNYRLSRARRTIENAFGILSGRFRILRKPIHASPTKAQIFVKAAIALHNFLRSEEIQTEQRSTRLPDANIQEYAQCGFRQITKISSNMHSRAAKDMRDQLANYFLNEGSVDFQFTAAGLNIMP